MSLRCLILDDEYPARLILENFIRRTPALVLDKSFGSPLHAFEYLEENQCDLLFLDIQMPQLSGIGLLKSLVVPPMTIFTTAYEKYALQSYDLNAIDYLLKPFSYERFLIAVEKAMGLKRQQYSSGESQDYLLFKSDHKDFRLLYEDIRYIEGMREYVRIHTNDRSYMTLETLKHLELTLPANRFFRIHKSFIVNMNCIKYLQGNKVVLETEQLPIGKSYKSRVVSEFRRTGKKSDE